MVAGDEGRRSVDEASVRALVADVEFVLAQPDSEHAALAAQALAYHCPPIDEALLGPAVVESQRRCRSLMGAVAGGQTVSSSYGLAFIHQWDDPPSDATRVTPPVRPTAAAHAAPPPSPFQEPPNHPAPSPFVFPADGGRSLSRGPWWKGRWVWVAAGLLAVAGIAQVAIESGGQDVAAEGAASLQPFAGALEESTVIEGSTSELPDITLAPTTAVPPTTAAPTTVAPTTVPPTTARPTTTRAPTTVAPTTVPVAQCDPNYSGCVPIASDVDCAGGSGNGPAYVRGPVQVLGSDIYGLDGDGDGVGCE